jgi:hypothetical protein
MKTKRDVQVWCDAHGVELSVERGPTWSHVHADIAAPRTIFRAHDLHNLGLWDDEASPNWREIGRELLRADIGPCTKPDCEACAEDND